VFVSRKRRYLPAIPWASPCPEGALHYPAESPVTHLPSPGCSWDRLSVLSTVVGDPPDRKPSLWGSLKSPGPWQTSRRVLAIGRRSSSRARSHWWPPHRRYRRDCWSSSPSLLFASQPPLRTIWRICIMSNTKSITEIAHVWYNICSLRWCINSELSLVHNVLYPKPPGPSNFEWELARNPGLETHACIGKCFASLLWSGGNQYLLSWTQGEVK